MSSPTSGLPASPLSAALAAAEARARAAVSPTSSPADAHSPGPFVPSVNDKLPFHRIIDSQLLPKTSKSQAVKSLQILSTIVGNILNPPDPSKAAKFRQLKLSNPNIKRNVVDVPGAYEVLAACGFREMVTSFEAHLTFPSSPPQTILHKLKTANFVLTDVLGRAKEAEDREKRAREYEAQIEKARKANALLGFSEDRRLKAEKDAREKIVRQARAAAETSAAGTAAQQHRDHLADQRDLPPVVFARSTRAQDTMTVGSGESDCEEEDQPPSYGMLHGRVLGTGQPAGVERAGVGVSRQDLEEEL